MSSKQMNSVDLNCLINLIHVPEINLEFKKQLDKFEGKDIAQHILDFQQREWELFIELYQNRVESGAGSSAAGEFFWFELTYYGPDDWRLTNTYPFYDVSIVPQYEILPHQVIEKIIDTPVKPREIRSAFNLEAVFWRKVVNVKFCRLSEGFICGTVELCKRLQGHIDRKKEVSIGPRAFEMTFRKFHYLFLCQPALIYSFILDFLKIKIPGLKIMAGKEQESNLSEPVVNSPGIDPMMRENPQPGLTGNTGGEPVNLYDLINAPKSNLVGRMLQFDVEKLAGYEYKKQVDDYETRLEQIRRDLMANVLEQLGRSGQDPDSYPPLYWFELSPFMKENWGITLMKPIPEFVPYKSILPDEMVKLISRETLSPGNTVTFYNGGDGKLIRPVKYWVVRLTPGHIAGIAVMAPEKIRERHQFEDSPVVTGLYSAYWILDRYLHRNPGEVKELAFRFQEAYANGAFGPVVFPTPKFSLLSLINRSM